MSDPVKPLCGEQFRENALTYGRTPSSPATIRPAEIEKWRKQVSPTFRHYIQKQYDEIVEQYQALVEQYELNKMIYESDMSFEPVMGQVYHLYEDRNGGRFLSLVSPEDKPFWGGYIGSYKLNSQYAWEPHELG